MIQAAELHFDLNDSGIRFTGTYKVGERIQREIAEGDNVALKKSNIHLEVEKVEFASDGTFIGVVQYVWPYQALSEEGIDEGAKIGFSYKHVFACRHR